MSASDSGDHAPQGQTSHQSVVNNDNNNNSDMSASGSRDHAPLGSTNKVIDLTRLYPVSSDDDDSDNEMDDERSDDRANETNFSALTNPPESPPLVSSSEDGSKVMDKVKEKDNDGDDDVRMSMPPPPPSEAPTGHIRSEIEEQIEKNERRDEVEPGLTEFRKKRELHVRQLQDLNKKALMVSNRIDKLNDDVEKLRQQWGDMEREKAQLLVSSETYEQKTIKQEKVVHKDDKKAKKYHDYLTLAEEVLMLDDSDDDEDEDRPVFDWGAFGHGGGAESDNGK